MAQKLLTLCLFSVLCITKIDTYNLQRIETQAAVTFDVDSFQTHSEEKRIYEVRNEINFSQREVVTDPPESDDSSSLDSWSVVWYIASFGGLIIFFLIVSCSEWCCRRAIRNGQQCDMSNNSPNTTPVIPDTPPPSYDQFAPPSYESICLGRSHNRSEKSEFDIYVVPVHAFGTILHDDAPPSYQAAYPGRNSTTA